MHIFLQICSSLSHAMRPHTSQIAMGFIATILVIFGNDLSGLVQKWIKNFNFFVRILIFVLICAVGYTLIADWLIRLVRLFLLSLDNRFYSPIVIVSFVIAGIIAERKKYM